MKFSLLNVILLVVVLAIAVLILNYTKQPILTLFLFASLIADILLDYYQMVFDARHRDQNGIYFRRKSDRANVDQPKRTKDGYTV
jgi:uncharacterized protein YacL